MASVRETISLINRFGDLIDSDILMDLIFNYLPSMPETLTNKTITSCTINNDVTGNLTGDVTGNVTGNVTGDLTGSVTLEAGDTFEKETNDLTITTASGKTIVLSQPVWDDLRFSVDSVRLDGSKPPVWTTYKGGQALAFQDQAVNYQVIYFVAQMPHTYKLGTDLEFHVHWVPEDDTAGNVYWEFTYSWADINGAFPSETTINLAAAAPAVADKHTYSDFTTSILASNKVGTDGVSSMLICSLARRSDDDLDTFAGKYALFLEGDIHYQIDTIGSRLESTK
jgi:hypothetical protein